MARDTAEPPKSGAAGAERWIGYLDWLRSDLAAAVLALSEADQRTPRVPSGWTPLELLSHVLHMEQRWFVWGFLGEPVAEPWGDWNVEEPWLSDDADETRPRARWTVAESTTAEELAARLREIGARAGRNVVPRLRLRGVTAASVNLPMAADAGWTTISREASSDGQPAASAAFDTC